MREPASTVSPTECIILLFLANLIGKKWFLSVVLICISIIINEGEYLFKCMLACVCELSIHVFHSFLCQDFDLSPINYRVPYVCALFSLYLWHILQILLPLCHLSVFCSWCLVSWKCGVFLTEPKFSILFFIAPGQRRAFPTLRSCRNLPCFLLTLVWFYMFPSLSHPFGVYSCDWCEINI